MIVRFVALAVTGPGFVAALSLPGAPHSFLDHAVRDAR